MTITAKDKLYDLVATVQHGLIQDDVRRTQEVDPRVTSAGSSTFFAMSMVRCPHPVSRGLPSATWTGLALSSPVRVTAPGMKTLGPATVIAIGGWQSARY
jgi:hypothetical protein